MTFNLVSGLIVFKSVATSENNSKYVDMEELHKVKFWPEGDIKPRGAQSHDYSNPVSHRNV